MRSSNGIGEIGAFGGLRARGDQEQPLEPHRVIDAQHPGVAHVGAIERAERRPALARAGERVRRRQAPVLALGGEWIGRRADRDAARKNGVMRPRLRSVRRRADREIAIESDVEAAFAPALGRATELAVGEPLAEKGELEAWAIALDRLVDRLRFARRADPEARAASSRRPHPRRSPGRRRSAAKLRRPLSRRHGSRRSADRWALRRGRGRRRRSRLRARCAWPARPPRTRRFWSGRGRERRREGGERRVDRRVARQAGAVERVDENRIEEAAIGRIVGARAVAVAREQHMQRADAEIGRPGGARFLAGERQRREVADPLVAAARPRAAGRRAGRRRRTASAPQPSDCGLAAGRPSARIRPRRR